MSFRKASLAAALALSVAGTSAVAQTAVTPAPVESVSRSGASLIDANAQDDDRGTSTYIVSFFVIITIALGLYFAFDGNDDKRVSP